MGCARTGALHHRVRKRRPYLHVRRRGALRHVGSQRHLRLALAGGRARQQRLCGSPLAGLLAGRCPSLWPASRWERRRRPPQRRERPQPDSEAALTTVAVPPEALRTSTSSVKDALCRRARRAAALFESWIRSVLVPPLVVTRMPVPITVCGGVPAGSPLACEPCRPRRLASEVAMSSWARPATCSETK